MISTLNLKQSYGERVRRMKAAGVFGMTFKPGVNLLVGPNGSGKSTVLHALSDERMRESFGTTRRTRFYSFDTEKQNPRVQSHLFDDPSMMRFQIGAMFASHGETMLPMLTTGLERGIAKPTETEDCLVIMDEPETALDHDALSTLIAFIVRYSGPGYQWIVATHSPRVMLIPGATVHEFEEGYRERVLNDWRELLTGAKTDPLPKHRLAKKPRAKAARKARAR